MRLLVIEDSDILRDSLVYGLRRLGHAVDGAADGEEGLWQAQNGSFDLIILDINLPGIDGFSILSRLRSEGHRVPILMLTARDRVKDRILGLEEGADDYLVKPFDFGELVARIQALLRRANGHAAKVIRAGALEIDLAAREVRRDGSALAMARREFALLECLALKAGQLVTRTEIEAAIYDERVEPLSNVVDAAISILRRQIDTAGEPSHIQTRRGQGYLLRIP